MKEFRIYIKSNEHQRTINTPTNGRTNYTMLTVMGKDALLKKVTELKAKGERITEIRDCNSNYVWL